MLIAVPHSYRCIGQDIIKMPSFQLNDDSRNLCDECNLLIYIQFLLNIHLIVPTAIALHINTNNNKILRMDFLIRTEQVEIRHTIDFGFTFDQWRRASLFQITYLT